MAPARGRDLPRSPANGAGTEQLLAKPPGPGEGRPRDSPLGTRGLATTSLWGPLCQAAPLQPALSVPPPTQFQIRALESQKRQQELVLRRKTQEVSEAGPTQPPRFCWRRAGPRMALPSLPRPTGATLGCHPSAPRGSLSKRGGVPSSMSKHRPLDPFSVRDSVAPVFPRLAPPIWASSRLWAPCSLGPSFLAPRFPR